MLTWAWAFLQPAVQIALYAIVFGTLLTPRGTGFPSPGFYVIYLCVGIFCWVGFSEGVARGTQSLLEGASLIRGRGIATFLFPLRAVGTAWVLALVGFGGGLIISPLAGITPQWTWILIPLPLIALGTMAAGLALALAPMAVLVRDTVQVVHLVLPLAFWATPIVYDPSILPPWAQAIQGWNPLVPAVTIVQDLVVRGAVPAGERWAWMGLWAMVFLGAGLGSLRRLDQEVRDVL